MAEPQCSVIWGKSAKPDQGAPYHPLVGHLLDTGHVARALLALPGARPWRSRLAALLGVEELVCARWVSFPLASHDIGKCSPSFQRKSLHDWQQVAAAGLPDAPWPMKDFHHGLEGFCHLKELFGAGK